MLAEAPPRNAVVGRPRPRIAPPLPARSDIAGYRRTAEDIGTILMPWQDTAACYLTALGPDDRWLWREVAVIVSRQNGKTTLLIPLIVQRLLDGQRIMHTAQDRSLPREVFYAVAEYMWVHHPDLFPSRNGRPTKPRYANGQEEIRLTNGGVYSIVAPTGSGARGPSRDTVIVDELREMDAWHFMAAAKPTLTTSKNPQTIYLSNAGTEDSIVLNALRDRAANDPSLAYLEWSARPDRTADDREGWAESNPGCGHEVGEMGSIERTLEDEYRTAKLEGTMATFETEHLCRWVVTMRQRFVEEHAWNLCEAEELDSARKTFMAVSMDPEGRRASAALAWQQPDGTVALRMLFDVTGDPIPIDKFAADLRAGARKHKVSKVAFDPMTDAELAKYFTSPKAIGGREWANASSQFALLVLARKILWQDAAAVTDDLVWTARKQDEETGKFAAVRARDDRPITAALAAIRAVWLASGPQPSRPRIY